MVENQTDAPPPDGGGGSSGEEKIPAMQSLLDNPFLLLFLGVAVPSVFYTIWGIIEVAQIPIGQ